MRIKHAIDSDLPSGDYPRLLCTIGLYLLSSTLFLLFTYLLHVRLEVIGQGIIAELKNKLLAHVLSLSFSFYDKNPVGRLTARVETDTGTLKKLFSETSVLLFKDLLLFFGTIAVMTWFHFKLTLAASAIFPFAVLGMYLFVRKSSPLFLAVRKITVEIAAFLNEHLQAMGVLQCFNREESVRKKLDELNAKKFGAEFKAEFTAVFFFTSMFFLEPVAIALILGIGGKWALSQEITIGILVMFILYVQQIFDPLLHLSEHLNTIQRSFAGAQRIFDLLDTRPEVVDPKSPAPLSGIKKGIEFRNVWFRYREDGPWILKDVSFTAPARSRCALVGDTGGGKTTIVSLLFKFYVPQKGSILIDGTDIRDLSQKDLRALLGLVQQDIFLFPGTLMDNLKLMDSSVPDEKVFAAARMLGADQVTCGFSYDMQVLEKGANLSVGEKQVFSLIRAMVLNPEVLVLDEATSSVDPHTERVIRNASHTLLGGRTSIIIAHRLATVLEADQILVVSGGEIKERGAHRTLLKKGGLYSRLFKLQFGGAS